MKLVSTQENLSKGLNLCSKVVSSPKTLPILSNVLLTTENNKLKLSVTNLEIGINIWIRAKIDEEGSISVPARILSDLITNNRDKNINLETKELSLLVSSDNYKANISGVEAGEFPVIPTLEKGDGFEVSAKSFGEVIPRVIAACAQDESRPVLSGVLFNFKENKLKLVATDSYRLAEATVKLDEKTDLSNVIVPFRTMQEVERIAAASSEVKEKIKISVAENQILFKLSENIELSSRLIEGSFPSYEQIVPASSPISISINKNEFFNAIKTANLFSQGSTNNVILNVEKEMVEIISRSTQIGDSKINVGADVSGGAPLAVSFNARFIMDGLSALIGSKAELGLTDKLAAAKIVDPQDPNYLYVIMPLRTEE